MMQVSIVRKLGQAPTQYFLAFCVTPLLAEGICQIGIAAGEAWITRDSALEGGNRLVSTPLTQAQVAQIDAARGPVGLQRQRVLILLQGTCARRSPALGNLVVR